MSSADNNSQESEFLSLNMLKEYIDFSNLEVIDIVRSVALIIACLVMSFGECGGFGFKKGTEVGFLVLGIGSFFFPSSFIGYMVNDVNVDPVHEMLQQTVGAILLSKVLAAWHSNDESEQSKGASCLVRFVVFLGIFVLNTSAHFAGKINFSSQHLTFFLLFLGLMVFGHLVHIYRQGDFGRHTIQYRLNSGINRHLMIDIFIVALGAIMDLADTESSFQFIGYPKFKPTNLHIHMVKIFAMLEMGMLLMSMMALGFADDRDKKRVFVDRLVYMAFSIPLLMLYQWKHAIMTTNGLIATAVFLFIWLVNSVWPLFGSPVEVFHTVQNVASPIISPQVDRVLRRRKDN